MEPSVPLPSRILHSKANTETAVLQTSRRDYCPMEAQSTMVPLSSTTQHRPSSHKRPRRSTRAREINRMRLQRLRQMDRIQFLKHIFKRKYGEQIASKLINAYRASTKKQAESTWKTFKSWLPENQGILTSHVLMKFLIYLQEEKKLLPQTILSYRSSLALPIKEAFDIDLSSRHFSLLALQLPLQRRRNNLRLSNSSLTFFYL